MIDFEPDWDDLLDADIGYAPLDENIDNLRKARNEAAHGLDASERAIAREPLVAVCAVAEKAIEDLTDVLKDRDHDNSYHRKWLALLLKRSRAIHLHGEHADAVQWCHDNVEGEWELLEWLSHRILILWETSDLTHFKLRWTE